VGFVGMDNRGLEGIEYKYDELLSGKKSPVVSDDNGALGSSVSLTVDRLIQHRSEKELGAAVRSTGAIQGSVVVLEIKTGRILAVAKYPGFDPNFYYRYSGSEWKNYSITDSFEPGSTMKVISMAAVLEFLPDIRREYVCAGKIEIADETVKCTGIHGRVDLNDIIRYSCNSGMIQAMKGVRREDHYAMLQRFGFGRKTGVELPGESEGFLRPVSEWSGLSKYSLSIGQELSVNSIQLAAAFAAVANGGVYVVPTIIESVEGGDGNIIQSFYPQTRGRAIRADIARRILKMMRASVDDGTGNRAGINYYSVAGKTGTAQKSMKKGGYYSDRMTASFVGIAPYEDPEICILVALDEPGGASGGGAAAPVFARISERILPYLGIKYGRRQAAAPRRTETVKFTGDKIPDFRGMPLSESLRILVMMQKKYPVTYGFEGTGVVHSQSPAPGVQLENNQKIKLYLRER
jgi:cell division protein FtsI (penicillin-binding protein 3)